MAHILIVERDEMLSELVSEMVISAGHACGWVADRTEAEKLLRWRRPDLLILSQELEGDSGTNFLRELRNSARFYDLPVILMSASSGQEEENRAYYNGAQGFVSKPVNPKVLMWRVNQTLRARGEYPGHRDLNDMAELHSQANRPNRPAQNFV